MKNLSDSLGAKNVATESKPLLKERKYSLARNGMIVLVTIVCLLSGCARQQIHTSTRPNVISKRIIEKNYEIGQKLAAHVGDPIVRVKDYNADFLNTKHMRASEDFALSGGIISLYIYKDNDYKIAGETTIDGNNYTVVDIPGQGGYYRILIKPDGSVHSKILNNDIVMFYTFTSSRPDVNFTISSKEQVNYTALKLNYELIYGGTDGKSITITYREYTGQDLVRPAFFQNLVYDRNEKNIRFRDTMIQIYDVTNEKIVFTVLSDGL